VAAVVVQRLRIGDAATGEGQAGLAGKEGNGLGRPEPLGMAAALEQAGGD
jgi:hypothetical protein